MPKKDDKPRRFMCSKDLFFVESLREQHPDPAFKKDCEYEEATRAYQSKLGHNVDAFKDSEEESICLIDEEQNCHWVSGDWLECFTEIK